jgi:predicted GIY-YIG superfamily endonuclease
MVAQVLYSQLLRRDKKEDHIPSHLRQKISKAKRDRGVAQMVMCLPHKLKDLNSSSRTAKKKKRKEEKHSLLNKTCIESACKDDCTRLTQRYSLFFWKDNYKQDWGALLLRKYTFKCRKFIMQLSSLYLERIFCCQITTLNALF